MSNKFYLNFLNKYRIACLARLQLSTLSLLLSLMDDSDLLDGESATRRIVSFREEILVPQSLIV